MIQFNKSTYPFWILNFKIYISTEIFRMGYFRLYSDIQLNESKLYENKTNKNDIEIPTIVCICTSGGAYF